MVFVPVTVLGGLPAIAEVWFSGPDYFGEYDAGVDGLYWQRSDGSKGALFSERMMDRVEKDSYWDAYVTEQANDWLSAHTPIVRRFADGRVEQDGEWSEDYIRLNGDPKIKEEPRWPPPLSPCHN